MLGFIAKGEWKPGEKIPSEAILKEQFSVSRISVREALQKLSALGLINSRPGLGTFVSDVSAGLYLQNLIPIFLLDKPTILQVLEFRKALEVESAKIAAERATPEEITVLKEILEHIKASEFDITEYSKYDLQFHSAIFEMTKNPLIIKVNLMLQQIFQEVFFLQTESASNFDYDQHAKIFKAIESKRPKEAFLAMREHINYTIDRITNKK